MRKSNKLVQQSFLPSIPNEERPFSRRFYVAGMLSGEDPEGTIDWTVPQDPEGFAAKINTALDITAKGGVIVVRDSWPDPLLAGNVRACL